MLYLCDILFIFIFISVLINDIISLKQALLLFCTYFRICPILLDDKVDEESKEFSIRKSSASECCLAFA